MFLLCWILYYALFSSRTSLKFNRKGNYSVFRIKIKLANHLVTWNLASRNGQIVYTILLLPHHKHLCIDSGEPQNFLVRVKWPQLRSSCVQNWYHQELIIVVRKRCYPTLLYIQHPGQLCDEWWFPSWLADHLHQQSHL